LYFTQLLDLQFFNSWARTSLLEGFFTSSGAGAEKLLRSSRAALVDFVDHDSGTTPSRADVLQKTLVDVLRRNLSNDRVAVPTLETIAFLYDVDIMGQVTGLRNIIQRAHYKTTNVGRLEGAVKVYMGMGETERLIMMLRHPFPKIRHRVVDALWMLGVDLRGVDSWSKDDVERLKSLVTTPTET
jgi:hypothetical protein